MEKEKTMPSATIRLTFLGGRDFLVNPYLRVSQALYENKNYNLLSSVTVSDVIAWIWIINEVVAVGDGSVTANFAVTLPCFQWLLMGCWLVYTELFSFSRLKLLFLLLGTKVSSAWNFSFKAVKPKFRTLENSGSSRWNEWNKAGNWSLTLYFPNNGWLVYL